MACTFLKKNNGFTLIELLVTMTIFSILLVAVISIFMQAQKAQRQAASFQQLQADGRYLVTKISNEFQNNGAIDFGYALYTEPAHKGTLHSDGVERLAIVLSDGTKHVYGLNTSFDGYIADPENISCGFQVRGVQKPTCLMMQEDGGELRRVSASGIVVENVRFYLSPNVDPFIADLATGTYASDTQPHVTISLTEKSYIRGLSDPAVVHLQTTLTSREYKR